MNNTKHKIIKIGIVDSGIGGLSTLCSIANYIPQMQTNIEFVYFADTDYCPYGNKSKQIVLNRVKNIIKSLIQQGCNIIVVACNTATNIGLSEFRQEFTVPVVGTEPAIKPAFEDNRQNTLLLATHLTVQQPRFLQLVHRFYDQKFNFQKIDKISNDDKKTENYAIFDKKQDYDKNNCQKLSLIVETNQSQNNDYFVKKETNNQPYCQTIANNVANETNVLDSKTETKNDNIQQHNHTNCQNPSIFVNTQTGQKLIVAPQQHLATLIENSIQSPQIKKQILNDKSYLTHQLTDPTLQQSIATILQPYQNIDGIILGCTHYCSVKNLIQNHYANQNRQPKIYDGNDGIAKRVALLINNL